MRKGRVFFFFPLKGETQRLGREGRNKRRLSVRRNEVIGDKGRESEISSTRKMVLKRYLRRRYVHRVGRQSEFTMKIPSRCNGRDCWFQT